MSEPTSLQTLSDRQTITDLIYRYCRAIDRMDNELGYTLWHEDGTADYGADVYQGNGRGFVDQVCEQHRHTLTHSHQITNVIIELDGDLAGSEAYVTANLRMLRGEKLWQISVWSRYVDQWSRRSGRWAIDKRVAVIDFDEVREVTPLNKSSRGSRDRNDPSYLVLRSNS